MITVSIISGSQEKNLEMCLESLGPAMSGIDWKLVVVDNCSSWDVERLVRKYFSHAEIIKNDKPMGFGANHNRALLGRQDDFALVLNDDLELEKESIHHLINFARRNPKAALLGPLIHPGSWKEPCISSGGACRDLLPRPIQGMITMIVRLLFGNLVISEFLKHREKAIHPETMKLSYICGACCLVSRAFIEKNALYDSLFYMYYEDIDLGRRARKAGYECWQVGDAKIMHLGGGSFNEKTWSWFAESAIRFAEKHHGPLTLFLTRVLVRIFKSLHRMKGAHCAGS